MTAETLTERLARYAELKARHDNPDGPKDEWYTYLDVFNFVCEADHLYADLLTAQAEIERLREALEVFHAATRVGHGLFCPLCGGLTPSDHFTTDTPLGGG